MKRDHKPSDDNRMMSEKLTFKRKAMKFVEANITQGVTIDNVQYFPASKEVEAVECDKCGKRHLVNNSGGIKFLSIYGNVHVNDGGGLLGNANWDEYGVPTYHFCPECLIEEIKTWCEERGGQNFLHELESR